MIPGIFVAIVTFPGVIVHEIAHQLFCRLSRVAVLDVCYFRVGNPAGYVLHEIPARFSQSLLISIGPFLVNTLLGAVIAAPGAVPVLKFGGGSPLDYFLIWLGVSIAMHSFPSTGDAQSIWEGVKSGRTSAPWRLLATPLVAAIYVGAIGSIFWLDLAYGVAIATLVPQALVAAIA